MFTESGQFFTSSGGYEIDQSIRFNAGDTPSLSRTIGTPTSTQKFTFSTWIKPCTFFNDTATRAIFSAATPGNSSVPRDIISWENDALYVAFNTGSWAEIKTNQVFRDPASWYHIVVAMDTTQSTASNRTKIYVNGSQVTDFSTASYVAQNDTIAICTSGKLQAIGAYAFDITAANDRIDGYLSEINFVDGTAKAASDFGGYDSNGVWVPKKYTGSYGTNGFYLKGQDSSALGDDSSGNTNDFTSSGLAAADQVTDTPTNNFATWNPLIPLTSGNFSDGNLEFTVPGSTKSQHAKSTISFTSGEKKVCEMQTVSGSSITLGICDVDFVADNNGFSGDSRGYFDTNGNKIDKDGNGSSYGASFGTSNVIRIEVDLSNNPGTIEFFKDGVSQGDAFTDIDSSKTWFFWCRCKVDAVKANFGQLGFAGTPTTGFTALNTANLPTPTISDGSKYFQTTLYTGTGSSRSVDQSGNSTFQPDWVWVKSRGTAADHALYDVLRGVQKELKTNATDAEATVTTGLTAFESDGFQVGSRIGMNGSSDTFVAWQWKANGSGSSNEDGSINTTATSANTTAGFSISTYTGTGSAATIGHGLGVTPSMIIVKKRVSGSDDGWTIWHTKLPGANYYLNFDNGAQDTSVNYWNNTLPTSSVFSVGASNGTNQSSKTFVAYCFAEIPGYSSFGKYVGNGSATAAPFIYTGFRPAYVITKNLTNSGDGWPIVDNKRSPFNTPNATVLADLNVAETTGYSVDLYSNGFRPKSTDHSVNESGATIIYMAFAEHPFGGDGVAPVTAR